MKLVSISQSRTISWQRPQCLPSRICKYFQVQLQMNHYHSHAFREQQQLRCQPVSQSDRSTHLRICSATLCEYWANKLRIWFWFLSSVSRSLVRREAFTLLLDECFFLDAETYRKWFIWRISPFFIQRGFGAEWASVFRIGWTSGWRWSRMTSPTLVSPVRNDATLQRAWPFLSLWGTTQI